MSEDPNNAWNSKTGSFIKRPGKGWLHADEKLEREEVVYHIKVSGFGGLKNKLTVDYVCNLVYWHDTG